MLAPVARTSPVTVICRCLECHHTLATSRRVACRYHTIEIQAGDQIVTAADPLPDDIRATLQRLHGSE